MKEKLGRCQQKMGRYEIGALESRGVIAWGETVLGRNVCNPNSSYLSGEKSEHGNERY